MHKYVIFSIFVNNTCHSKMPTTCRIIYSINLLPPSSHFHAFVSLGQYPGLFIFSGAARIMRPVWNLSANCVEYIGTLEQVYMEVCTRQTEAVPMLTTHKEIRLTNFLSNLACTIPLPDFNQSPRYEIVFWPRYYYWARPGL